MIDMSKTRVGLIATMPRSGTWFHRYFFYVYDQIGRGRRRMNTDVNFDAFFEVKETIGLDYLQMNHLKCPGFLECYRGEYRERWDRLEFMNEGYDHGSRVIAPCKDLFDPLKNPDVRIAYCSRNPLDQAVSIFRHLQNHVLRDLTYTRSEDGRPVRIESVREFIRLKALESYMKQYFTFKVMTAEFPGNIIWYRYEELVNDPAAVFERVLRFFGHDTDHPRNKEIFQHALRMTSRESMMKLENQLGRALGGDQTDPRERHIRDGKVGKWKKHLEPGDLEWIEARLNELGISLDEFALEPDAAEPAAVQ